MPRTSHGARRLRAARLRSKSRILSANNRASSLMNALHFPLELVPFVLTVGRASAAKTRLSYRLMESASIIEDVHVARPLFLCGGA